MPDPVAGSAPPIPPASTLKRRRAMWRAVMAMGETRLQLLLAAIITVGAGFWAWALAASAFPGPPVSKVFPGVIGVAMESHGPAASAPIEIDANYGPSQGQAATNLQLVFTQTPTGNMRKRPSPDIIVFICGEIARHRDFLNGRFQPVRWQAIRTPDTPLMLSTFGYVSQCVYTTLAMNPARPGTGFRQALLMGSSGLAQTYVSGTRILYTLPGIASWFLKVSIDGLTSTTLPAGSTLNVRLDEDASDLTNMFASPQLRDAGTLTWTSKFDGTSAPISEYQLEADSLTAVSALQSHLFIAGALVGVAGGAFVWLVQLCGQAGYGAATERAKRRKSAASQEETTRNADGETPLPAASSQPVKPVGTGLGWPS